MPTIAHLILGGVLATCLYYLSNGKFSKTHAFILFLNNYLGPDVGWVFGIAPITHSVVGWALFAFILAPFYYYFTRFTVTINGVRNIELVEREDGSKLPYLNTYFLVLAGGIMHVYLDGVINYGGTFYLIPPAFTAAKGLTWTIPDYIGLWRGGVLPVNPALALLVGIGFVFGFIAVFVWALVRFSKKAGAVAVLYVAAFMAWFYLAGVWSTAHSDAGAIFYVGTFWVTPLLLCVLSTRPVVLIHREHSRNPLAYAPTPHHLSTRILQGAYFLIGIVFAAAGALLLVFHDRLFDYLVGRGWFDAGLQARVGNASIIISVVLLGLGIIPLVCFFVTRKKGEHHKNLLGVGVWLFFTGILGAAVGLIAILFDDLLVGYAFSAFSDQIGGYISQDSAYAVVMLVGWLLLVLVSFNYACAVGLTLKNHTMWKVTVYYHLCLTWTIIGLVIACGLSETAVKQVIHEKGNQMSQIPANSE